MPSTAALYELTTTHSHLEKVVEKKRFKKEQAPTEVFLVQLAARDLPQQHHSRVVQRNQMVDELKQRFSFH